MALNEQLKRFLDQQKIAYQTLPHREVFTAQEVAATAHVSGRQLAKVVVVRENGRGYLMVVLPAACRVDLTALKNVTGMRKLSLAPEEEFVRLFPDCDAGAMPPFGSLYDMPVYMDACFPRAKDIFFQGGNHREVVQLSYQDYERLVRPTVGEFCLHAREKDIGA